MDVDKIHKLALSNNIEDKKVAIFLYISEFGEDNLIEWLNRTFTKDEFIVIYTEKYSYGLGIMGYLRGTQKMIGNCIIDLRT